MKYIYGTPNEDIEKVFAGHEFNTVVFKSNFNVGDKVKLKTARPKNRFSTWYKEYSTDEIYTVVKMDINVYAETLTIICELCSETKNEYNFSEYIYDVPSTEFEIIDGHDFEYSLITPFLPGDYCWVFLNHLYDRYTPNYNLIIGHRLNVTMNIGKETSISVNPVVITKRWAVEKRFQGDEIKDFQYLDSYRLTKTKFDNTFKHIGLEPLLYTIQMVDNDVDFDTFAQKTYKKDSFRDAYFSKPIYEMFAKQKGKTLEDLKIASEKPTSSVVKNKPVPRKKPKSKTDDKLKDLINGLSEAELEKLKNLLN